MYYLYDCEQHNKSLDLDGILQDFMNDLLKYEGQKLCKILQMTYDTHEISDFINNIMNNNICVPHHLQIPTILAYCERQLCHKPTAYLFPH